MKFIDLTGRKFGRLTALFVSGSRKGGGSIWKMQCECGNIVDCDGANVRSGRTKSCGCLQNEVIKNGARTRHGLSKTRTHNIWCGMHQRCENKNAEAYADYGARGIAVCKRWRIFENFLEDMGRCPPGMTIERTDNDGNYEPDNCVWATRKVQVRNRRNSGVIYEHDGVALTLKDWGDRIGVPYQTMWHRYKIGKRGHDLLANLRVTRQPKRAPRAPRT